jgi:zinc transport system ATP-binding protein
VSLDEAIAVRGVDVALGGRPVLHQVDLGIHRGEFLVLLGGNGSGKTTLVRTMLGLVPYQRGLVRLLGTPLPRFRDWKRIGYVPQRLSLPTSVPATVGEVVLSGRISHSGLVRPYSKIDRAAAERALENADLIPLKSERVSRLSGGQQQRVLIARALAGEPDVVLLDEPVSHVDLQHQFGFADLLRSAHSAGATVVLVAHGLGAMAGLATRALVLDGGRVVYDGDPTLAPTHDHDFHHEEMAGEGALRSIGEER